MHLFLKMKNPLNILKNHDPQVSCHLLPNFVFKQDAKEHSTLVTLLLARKPSQLRRRRKKPHKIDSCRCSGGTQLMAPALATGALQKPHKGLCNWSSTTLRQSQGLLLTGQLLHSSAIRQMQRTSRKTLSSQYNHDYLAIFI